MFTLKNNLKIVPFVLILSGLNLLFFHYPFFKFVANNVNCSSGNGLLLLVSLAIAVVVVNAFVFFLFFAISRPFSKLLLSVFFMVSSIAVYFVNSYSVIIDESMIGNVLNTKYSEASSFFSIKLIIYLFIFGILPSIFIFKTTLVGVSLKKFFKILAVALLFILILVFSNASNVLWIDKNSKTVGGLAMPWSYVVNLSLFYKHKSNENEKEILLPTATLKNQEKAVVVLVIGESARRQNFSLYGYAKNTNPLLSKTPNVFHFDANAAATYTTAGVKAILEHQDTGDLYEILPNYLERNKVEVVWRTNNWGEPPLHIKNYQNREALAKNCQGNGCNYDEVLLTNLKEQILSSTKNKILIVLHTSTSHGPLYSTKYPSAFEKFSPVCKSVELGNCSQTDLINAYDNTIVYTDFLLHQIIETLKPLKQFKSSMIFVSDHGESLGENNLYMHGVPISIAPKEQYQIPFIVWVSNSSKGLKANKLLSQNHVFHSVLHFLDVESPIYDENKNIFK